MKDLQADLDLVRSAASGDEAAWRRIFEQTCARLFSLLCFQTGDRDEARDLMQETYLQAYRKLGAWRGEAPLETWLRAIALRKACDWKRALARRIRTTVPLDEAMRVVSAPPPGPEAEAEEFERAALRHALARLSPHQRAALLLRELEERSFAEIAAVLRCQESTARVHHTRARQRMKQLLGAHPLQVEARDWEGQRT